MCLIQVNRPTAVTLSNRQTLGTTENSTKVCKKPGNPESGQTTRFHLDIGLLLSSPSRPSLLILLALTQPAAPLASKGGSFSHSYLIYRVWQAGRQFSSIKKGPENAPEKGPEMISWKGHMSQLQKAYTKNGPKMHPKTHPKKGPRWKNATELTPCLPTNLWGPVDATDGPLLK